MAQGDSWSDPIIVDNWNDYLENNTSSKYIKFANPHEINGTIVVDGSGTSDDPYVVSSYEELIAKTGASSIWHLKLISREPRKYVYDDVYCLYDDSESIIDFNDIAPTGYTSNLVFSAHTDFNGWTLKNIVMKSAMFRVSGSECKNAIISNLMCDGYHGSSYCYCDYGFENFIVDMLINNDSSNLQTVIYSSTNEAYSLRNSAIKLTVRGNASINALFTNCKVMLDIMSTRFDGSVFDSKNTMFTGKINTTSSDSVTLGDDIYNTIFDLEYSGNGYLSKTSYVYNASFYNSDKVSDTSHLTANNLYAATTVQLKDAQWLYDHGFPIGVD